MKGDSQGKFENIIRTKNVLEAQDYIENNLLPMISNINEGTDQDHISAVLSQYRDIYKVLSDRSVDPRIRRMMGNIQSSLEEIPHIMNASDPQSLTSSYVSSAERRSSSSRKMNHNGDAISIMDDPANYRRFSSRKKSKISSDKELREELLDFIKTKLDAPLYNRYMNSINRAEFQTAYNAIEDTMYQIHGVDQNPDLQFSMTQDQMRNYLLDPIREAASQGNEEASQVMVLAARSQYERISSVNSPRPFPSLSRSSVVAAPLPPVVELNSQPADTLTAFPSSDSKPKRGAPLEGISLTVNLPKLSRNINSRPAASIDSSFTAAPKPARAKTNSPGGRVK